MLRSTGAWRAAAVLLAAIVVSACGATAPPAKPATAAKPAATAPAKPAAPAAAAPAPASAAPQAKLFPLSFSMSFVPTGNQASYYAALDEGYYRAAGLDVHLVKGVNPATSIRWLIGHKVTMTEDDANITVPLITKGAPLRIVALTIQGNPFGLIYRADNPLTKPQDVYGKRIGVPTGTDAATYWDAFVTANHLDAARVHVVNVSIPTEAGLLGAGRVDAISGAGYTFLPLAAARGLKAGILPYSKYGVGGLSNDIVTTDAFLKSHPGVVRHFLAATAKGFAFAEQHPKQAAADEVRADPQKKLAPTEGQLLLSLKLLHSANTKGKPWGWESAADWHTQLKLMQRFMGLKHPLPAARYYTNSYLPKS